MVQFTPTNILAYTAPLNLRILIVAGYLNNIMFTRICLLKF